MSIKVPKIDDWRDRVTPEDIRYVNVFEVFVFGSNTDGLHIGGAAKLAHKEFGAEWGVSTGMTGKCFAIPTVNLKAEEGDVKMPLTYIKDKIQKLNLCAKRNKDKTFLVTEIGCGIAGFTPDQIAPLFAESTKIQNIHLPLRFWRRLNQI